MSATTYNGWTNYETWVVKLWLDNDEGTYRYWHEQARAAFDSVEPAGRFTRAEEAAFALRDQLKDELDEQMHEAGVPELCGFYADLLNAALSEVNWWEIATAMIEEAAD